MSRDPFVVILTVSLAVVGVWTVATVCFAVAERRQRRSHTDDLTAVADEVGVLRFNESEMDRLRAIFDADQNPQRQPQRRKS